MNTLTAEWVDKAEGDYASAKREMRARVQPNYDSACFHAQQCVEKYLKAVLQEAGIPFGKSHNLEALLNLCLRVRAAWGLLRAEVQLLTDYAVAFRYPGPKATKEDARVAVLRVRELREHFRTALGLPSDSQ